MGYDSKIHVLYAEEYEKSFMQDMVNLVVSMHRNFGNVENIYVDGSSPEFIRALNLELGERLDYHEELADLKHRNMDIKRGALLSCQSISQLNTKIYLVIQNV